jgi:hypothetical protein
MLATTMGIQFDPDIAWQEKEQLFKTSGMIIKTANITQTATRQKRSVDNYRCNHSIRKRKKRQVTRETQALELLTLCKIHNSFFPLKQDSIISKCVARARS